MLLAVPGPAPEWTRIDTSNDVDEKAVVAFIDAYRGVAHHTCPVEELPNDRRSA